MSRQSEAVKRWRRNMRARLLAAFSANAVFVGIVNVQPTWSYII